MTRNDLQWGAAYERLLPIFSAVLRRFANQQALQRSSQGLEIIHDFFVDEWPVLERSFDSTRGTFEAYATYAFIRFARRWLSREARIARTFEGSTDIDDNPDGAAADAIVTTLDSARIRAAVARLPASDRKALEQRFGVRSQSEREISTTTGKSRHAVRLQVAEALTRLIAVLGEGERLSAADMQLAKAIFVDGELTSDICRRFGLSEVQVTKAKRRILSSIAAELGGEQ